MRNLKSCMLAGVALSCFGLSTGANAQQLFGAGSTFAAPTYRLLMDCWGIPADGVGTDHSIETTVIVPPIATSCESATGGAVAPHYQILFAPTGSGGGKQGLANHDPSTNASTGIKKPGSYNTIPFTSSYFPNYGYATLQFVGSDDPWLVTDQNKYIAAGGPAKYGKILEFPAFAGAAVIAYNGKDGNGHTITVGSGGLNLSRQSLCGIFSGHITQWSNASLTADNGGTALGSGQITVVHRSDGSGTSFILTNALVNQCVNVYGPNNESDTHLVSYAFPWTDRQFGTSVLVGTTPTGICNGTNPAALTVEGTDVANWPDLLTNQCGNSITQPTGAKFVQNIGNPGVAGTIQATNGAIGYSTTDYTQPVVTTGLPIFNVQNQYAINNPTVAQYIAPNATTVTAAFDTVFPWFPPVVTEANDITNPFNWSQYAVNPNPASVGAYPLVGFTFLDFYQCFKTTNTGTVVGTNGNPNVTVFDDNNLNITFSFLTYLYSSPTSSTPSASTILASQGFAPINQNNLSAWYDALVTLIAGGLSTQMGAAGTGSCASVSPGA